MLGNIDEIVTRLKKETNNLKDIIYRFKKINKTRICVIYNEPLVSSDKISDFIIRSLTSISNDKLSSKNLLKAIENDISNFKVSTIKTYQDLCFYMHAGFTVIIIEGENEGLVLETRADIRRSVDTPNTENAMRGSRDSFIEDYQTNLGLIKKRIKTNDLWIDSSNIGRKTQTQVAVLAIHNIAKPELVNHVINKLKTIDIDGVITSDTLKNLIENENKNLFPTIQTTERPDTVSHALLSGKIAIVVDNSPYVLLLPTVLNDFFKTSEDTYGKSLNVSLTRALKYLAFFIALLAPAVYISLITYNQEMIPTELLVSFATQRDGVPFPAFVEALIMIISFEILRESDLRTPSFTGSSLSIVGALILGEAAVNAGIVSPIMIIVIAITAISSLPFTELDLINSLRWYRLLFMIGATMLGVIGIAATFIFFLIKLTSLKSFGKPYLLPYAPTSIQGLKNSIIQLPLKWRNKRQSYLSDNQIKQRVDNNAKN